jgi:hypothetical protein
MRLQITRTFLLLVTLTGCSFGFESPGVVLDRRILAIQAEPPEFIVGSAMMPPPIVITALVVDPTDTGAPQSYQWRYCQPDLARTPFASAAAYDQTTQRCTEDSDANKFNQGDKPLADLTATLSIPFESITVAQGLAMAGQSTWTPVQVQLKVSDGTKAPLYATKQFVVSSPGPGDRLANKNPHLTGLLFDDKPWDATTPAVVTFKQCTTDALEEIPDPKGGAKATVKVCHHKITPVYDAATEEEAYLVQLLMPADDGSTKLGVTERLRFDWYTEQGTFTKNHTEHPSAVTPKATDPLSTKWVEPPRVTEAKTSRFWVVVSDGRGGTSWDARQITLNPAP